MANSAATRIAARNLVHHCAGLGAGDRLLILREASGLGYYDAAAAEAVAEEADACGIRVTLREVSFAPEVDALQPEVARLMAGADCTLFFARLGDQLRFGAMPAETRAVISYALDIEMLGSAFGGADHRAFVALKELLDDMIAAAAEIRVTCPLGTDFSGPGPGLASLRKADVSLARFPMSVFAPAPAAAFSGRAAIAGFLVGTGSRYYDPYGVRLSNALWADFSDGRLSGFDGEAADVAAAEAHYDDVSRRFGIDRNVVHSWHAGIHPGCSYRRSAHDDYRRWSGAAFGNPRILHFHTCGDYAPGEICWNIVDPTIRIDGVAVWEHGRLLPERAPGGADLLRAYPCAAALFRDPAPEIGIATNLLRRPRA